MSVSAPETSRWDPSKGKQEQPINGEEQPQINKTQGQRDKELWDVGATRCHAGSNFSNIALQKVAIFFFYLFFFLLLGACESSNWPTANCFEKLSHLDERVDDS